ncbi:hypothetical protein [Comamonas jiangduensis]|uniref:hypothetical protein n=1 Tax=Comamonas jiangduensis TaxID=1194168 RepID=UPI003BF7E6A6
MACIFEIELGASDVIALLAFLVAGLSALYARWSWLEARRANRISLLGHRMEIYNAFFDLKMHMAQMAEFAELSEVSKFYYPSRSAKIYLPSGLANDIGKYFDACFSIADIRRKYGGISRESSADCKPHKDTERDLVLKIDKQFMALLKEAQS